MRLSFDHPWIAIVPALLALAGPARADSAKCASAPDSGPSNGALVAAGLALWPVLYLAGVATHEGSHALAVKSVGGEVTDFSILPGFSRSGTFFFGHIRSRKSGTCSLVIINDDGTTSEGPVDCSFSDKENAFIDIAPKITDALILGGYSLALEKGWLEHDKWLKLGATLVATNALVDFAKDIPARNPDRDVPKFYDSIGATSEKSRFKYRLLHAALSAAAAYEVGKGYYTLFTRPEKKASRRRKGGKGEEPGTERHLMVEPGFVGVAGTF